MNLYLKTLHIIFIVTWFAGIFYMPRLFIYNTEANDRPDIEKKVLQNQFQIMMKRLWYGITWPSAVITLILGPLVWYELYDFYMFDWLTIKLCFVVGLYVYQFSLHYIFKQQLKGIFKYTSQQLRIWNEVATLFLVAIVALVEMQSAVNMLWLLIGLLILMFALFTAIRIYKLVRKN